MPRSGQTRVARSSWRRTLITWRNTAHPSGFSSTLRYIQPSYQSCDPTEILHSYPLSFYWLVLIEWQLVVSLGFTRLHPKDLPSERARLSELQPTQLLPITLQLKGGEKPSLISRPPLRTNVFSLSLSHAHMQRSTRVWSFKWQFKNTPVRSRTSTVLPLREVCVGNKHYSMLLNVFRVLWCLFVEAVGLYDYCKMWG